MRKIGIAALTLVLLGVATLPASATTLYDNTTSSSYGTNGWYNTSGYTFYSISNSFDLSSASTITGATFAQWVLPGATLSQIQWSIGSSAFDTSLASGTQNNPDTGFIANTLYGFVINGESISIPSLALGPGTYWLTLTNAVASDGGLAAWDESDGPSSAVDLGVGGIDSETFTIEGNLASTPEPSSLLLLGSGLAAFAGMLRRKLMA